MIEEMLLVVPIHEAEETVRMMVCSNSRTLFWDFLINASYALLSAR